MKAPGTIPSASNSKLFRPDLIDTAAAVLPSSKLGRRLKVVALVDPAIDRATAVLQKKCDSFVVSAYQDTRVYKNFEEFVKNMTPRERPRVIVIGSPPMFRGSLQSGRDIEAQILKHFPGVAIFVEKPIATGPVHEIQEGYEIAKMIHDSKTICSVGFVLPVPAHVMYLMWGQIHASVPQGSPEDEADYQ